MTTDEPRYSLWARQIASLFTPAGIDGFLLGLAVSLFGGITLYLWLTGQ